MDHPQSLRRQQALDRRRRRCTDGKAFDLRDIKAPIVLFASMGDNITPPQQAFNWVADVYGSTDEIKARGQTIVGLLHQDIGHLGIFVSGKVAKKEHAQIVSVLKSIEALPPGLYAMAINETQGTRTARSSTRSSSRSASSRRSMERLNRFERADEKPFEAVAAVSEFNQRAYELFAQPLVQAMSNEWTAKLCRQFHPLRFQRWALSDLNPWLAWLGPAAEAVRSDARRAAGRQRRRTRCGAVEKAASEAISAALDYYREMRDATSEATFFQTYGNVFSLYLADRREAAARETAAMAAEARELPYVKEALAAIEEGGYAEAVARVGGAARASRRRRCRCRASRRRQELAPTIASSCPTCRRTQMRRIRGEQDIIVRYEPEQALATLPALLAEPRRSRAAARARRAGCSPTSACRRRSRRPSRSRRSRRWSALTSRPRPRPAKRPSGTRARGRSERPRAATGAKRRSEDRHGTRAREVPAAARLLQDAAADADGGRASLRRELAARRRRRGAGWA